MSRPTARDALDNLASAMVDDILDTPAAELLSECDGADAAEAKRRGLAALARASAATTNRAAQGSANERGSEMSDKLKALVEAARKMTRETGIHETGCRCYGDGCDWDADCSQCSCRHGKQRSALRAALDAFDAEPEVVSEPEVVWLTDNDKRVLKGVEWACEHFDGYVPHGSRDWVAVRRLAAAGSIKEIDEIGECQTCNKPHESRMFVLSTEAARGES